MKILRTVLFVALICTGCIRSINPLSDPHTATLDTDLPGVWVSTTEDTHLRILANGSNQFTIVEVRHPKPQTEGAADESFAGFSTISGNHHFMNLEVHVPDDEQTTHQTRYCFFKYAVVSNLVQVWELDYEKIKMAMDSEKINGRAWETTWGANAILTDPGATLLRILEDNDDLWQLTKTYTRVQDVSP